MVRQNSPSIKCTHRRASDNIAGDVEWKEVVPFEIVRRESVVADVVLQVEVEVGLVEMGGGGQHLGLVVFVSRNEVGGEVLMHHLKGVQRPLHLDLGQEALLVTRGRRALHLLQPSLRQVQHLKSTLKAMAKSEHGRGLEKTHKKKRNKKKEGT